MTAVEEIMYGDMMGVSTSKKMPTATIASETMVPATEPPTMAPTLILESWWATVVDARDVLEEKDEEEDVDVDDEAVCEEVGLPDEVCALVEVTFGQREKLGAGLDEKSACIDSLENV
ncbi:hypothetical protein PUNSTDRAFT_145620 [Punctularia strigosozonata HHB-11173 SS5]|uniref:uncharacterized protein n=1 Tax=Punctularia strigosozonata (strain HHB-11173) TaxID=741275 RepID=UPI0004417F08|nr:uncharacterized protein PUNSTDRAFT_145620 [Punctularia strigosozonata HHB-11173 SS5]EIN05652.1 hypothetical protein PUNSTDRAFT_145620 [Punctularia strigosozonata HHB-11173 SS5]